MATFEVKVVRLVIEEHPNADALELARVGDYISIVPKGVYETGHLGVYIPEQAVVPDWLIAEMGLEGKLAGKQKNRVKAIKLRGILSQGLVYSVQGEQGSTFPIDNGVGSTVTTFLKTPDATMGVGDGDDVTEFLGITKYEPVIPTHMDGSVVNAVGYTLKYDIENIKRYPNVLHDKEQVVVTEKLHGTWACFGYHPDFGIVVTSKGLSGKGLAFEINEQNANNLYVKALQATADESGNTIVDRYLAAGFSDYPIYFLGEIFGKGVQDLQYGIEAPQFRGFDIYMGPPGSGYYMNYQDKVDLFAQMGVDVVPVLYRGPYTPEKIAEVTDGKETVSGTESCIREGGVITPIVERRDNEIGRVILKSVSEDYILRKNGTEFN